LFGWYSKCGVMRRGALPSIVKPPLFVSSDNLIASIEPNNVPLSDPELVYSEWRNLQLSSGLPRLLLRSKDTPPE